MVINSIELNFISILCIWTPFLMTFKYSFYLYNYKISKFVLVLELALYSHVETKTIYNIQRNILICIKLKKKTLTIFSEYTL